MGKPRSYCRSSDFGSEGEFVMSNGDQLDKLCLAKHEVIKEKFASMDKAMELSTKIMDKRLESLNELRKEVTEDRTDFMRKDYYEIRHAEMERWIKSVDTAVNKIDTRLTILETKLYTTVAAASAGVIILGSVIQIAVHFWKG